MATEPLADRLERDDSRTVSAFPDGSVDTFYAVRAAGERLDTRREFAAIVVEGRPGVVTLEREAVEPGGHAINVADQAHRLGNDVTLAGHLDDPVFADLPFETVSLGDPASVSVFGFDDGDLLAVENSPDVADWSLEELESALGHDFGRFLTADAVVCTNWTSIERLPAALAALAERDVDGEWFVLDPGSVADKSGAAVTRLFDAVERLGRRYDVVLAANMAEVRDLSTAVDGDAADVDEALDAISRATGVAAAIVHAEPRAAVATPQDVVGVENFDVEAVRHTGGGDRFDAGLAHALARGWDWEDALRLGNACASRYVATGESGSPDELAAFLRERE